MVKKGSGRVILTAVAWYITLDTSGTDYPSCSHGQCDTSSCEREGRQGHRATRRINIESLCIMHEHERASNTKRREKKEIRIGCLTLAF